MRSRRAPTRRASALASLTLLSSLAASCGGDAASAGGALLEIERLAFVPAGTLVLPTGRGEVVLEIREPLLFDMYEATRSDWLAYQRSRDVLVDADLAAFVDGWADGTDDWPATFMNADEAAGFARWRGMRLPSSGEWLVCALGPQRRLYPWGSIDQRGVANTLDLELGRVAPVGTFEAGRTRQHQVYDLLGNVAEWTRDRALSAEPRDDPAAPVSVLGGSFRNHSRPLFTPRPPQGEDEVFARTLPRASRADDVGTRCCVEARAYLAARARDVPLAEVGRARLVAVGRRWGPEAAGLLRELALEPDAAPALEVLLEGARRR